MSCNPESEDTNSGESEKEILEPERNPQQQNRSRFHALYLFNKSRFHQRHEKAESSEKNTDENTSDCLDILATNLLSKTEMDLRKTLSHKLTHRNKLPSSNEGKFCSLGLNLKEGAPVSASCYYYTLEVTPDSLGFDHVSKDGESSSPSQPELFVVCFLSLQESSLDPFRTEFELYIEGIKPLLVKEPISPEQSSDISCIDTGEDNANADQVKVNKVSSAISSYLEQWPFIVLEFVTRTIEYLGESIENLIYLALLNASLDIKGATPEQESDIRKFCQCCSMSPLLEQLQFPDTVPANFPSADTPPQASESETWQVQPVLVQITFQPDKAVSFDKTFNCQFCKNASEKILSHDHMNVSKTRDFLENIKLAFIHNLNKLKRFLQQAEVDHYALYRALLFLRKCGCGELLLKYVRLDASPGLLSVLLNLEAYIKEMKQTLY